MRLKKKSFTLHGHKTSVALEQEFWDGLAQIAEEKSFSLSQLVSHIDSARKEYPLASSLRLAVLNHYKQFSTGNLSVPQSQISSTFANSELKLGKIKYNRN